MNHKINPNKTPKSAPAYVGLSLRQRVLPTLLIAFAAASTVCLFGPFDIYGNNLDQFVFSIGDFIGWSLLFTLLGTAAITAILLPLRGKAYDTVSAVFFWLTLMLFAQGNFLNQGINSLTGDGVGNEAPGIASYVINTVVWLAVGAAIVFASLRFARRHRETLLTVCVIAMVTVIGTQTVSFALTSLTTDIWVEKNHSQSAPEDQKHVLTYKNLDRVSKEKNIIYFVVDRFDVIYYEDYGLVKCPELFEELDGFTYYSDMVSLYPRTFPSVAYMLSGIEHDFHDTRLGYFEEVYSTSPFLAELKKNHYNINIYTDTYYGYHDAKSMSDYVKNSSGTTSYSIENTPGLFKDMLRTSLFRYLPMIAKETTGNINSGIFEQYVNYEAEYDKYTTDMKDAYDFLSANPLTVYSGENNFSFIHITGCHMPNLYDGNFDPVEESDEHNPVVALQQSFRIINLYLEQLKELGLYEDATIIISGDHSNVRLDREFRGPHTTALFVKESGSADTPLRVSHAPVAQGDVIPTIFASEGIVTETDFGKPVWEYREGEERERKYVFQARQAQPEGPATYEVIVYKIKGSSRILANWEIVSSGDQVGSIYE